MEAPAAEDVSAPERGGAPPAEAVKRPMNSFLLYSNEMRPILQAQHRDSTNAQISKMLGAKWKAMTPQEKQTYVDAAAKVKIEFKAAHPDYVYTKTRRKNRKRASTSGNSSSVTDQEFLAYVPLAKQAATPLNKNPQRFVPLARPQQAPQARPVPPPAAAFVERPMQNFYMMMPMPVPVLQHNVPDIYGAAQQYEPRMPDFSPVL